MDCGSNLGQSGPSSCIRCRTLALRPCLPLYGHLPLAADRLCWVPLTLHGLGQQAGPGLSLISAEYLHTSLLWDKEILGH